MVVGILDPAFFGLPPDTQPPLDVIVPKDAAIPVPFRSISVVHRFPCLNEGNNITVTKIFSSDPFPASELQRIFVKLYDVKPFTFPSAYPFLDPYKLPEEIPGYGPYGPGIWFGGAFEGAFSCMEGQLVSARNLAGLLAEGFSKG